MQVNQPGTYVCAHLQGFETIPWANDPTKFNNRLVLFTEYEDRYGAKSRNYINVDVQQQDIQRIQQQASKHQGQLVVIPAIYQFKSGESPKTGKSYAFQTILLPKDSEITPVTQSQAPKAVNG
jgi:hypothetical protein